MDDLIKGGLYALAGAIGTLLGFAPKINRMEKDIEKKQDLKSCMEIKEHINTKFLNQAGLIEAQSKTIGEMDGKLDTLLTRGRDDAES